MYGSPKGWLVILIMDMIVGSEHALLALFTYRNIINISS